MNADLTQKLIRKYPVLFGGVNKPPTENLMCFGIECGDGWYQILDALCMMINGGTIMYINTTLDGPWYIQWWNKAATKLNKWRWIIRHGGKFHTPKYEFMQIKEKYGTLRVYLGQPVFDYKTLRLMEKYPKSTQVVITRWDNEVQGAICLAEDLSSITCEYCGKPGEACRRGLWIATMCPKCMASKEYATCRRHAEQAGVEPADEDKDEDEL